MSLKTIYNYTSQLSTCLNGGLPINRVLDVLARTAPTRQLRAVSNEVKESISSGSTLTQAFEKHGRILPDFFTKMISVGERTGRLEEVTSSLSSYYEYRYETSRTVKKELYPIVVYFAVLMALVVFIGWVSASTPENRKAVLQRYTHALAWIAMGGMALWGAYHFSQGFRDAIGSLLFHLPFVGRLVRKLCLSRFSEGMQLASETGLDIGSAIKLSSESSGNPAFRKRALRASEYIEKGSSISEALEKTGVFSFEAIQMFTVGEETGKLHEAMGHVSKHAREEALTTLHLTMVIGVRLFYILGVLYFAYKVLSFWTSYYQGIGL